MNKKSGDIRGNPGKSREAALTFLSGAGCTLQDAQGRSWLDFTSGLWNVLVGHGCAEITRAAFEQGATLAYHATFSGYDNEPSRRLSRRLCQLLEHEDVRKLLFCGSDTEVNETALKLARHYWKLQGRTQKTHVISLRGSHHGYHFASVAASDNLFAQSVCAPGIPDFSMVVGPIDFIQGAEPAPETTERICEAIEERLRQLGRGRLAALIAEPVQGPAGVVVPPADLWPRLREICTRHDALLIADEVITGFGRTGEWLACRHWGVAPDLITLGKGLTSGYASLGCVALCGEVADVFAREDVAKELRSLYFETAQPLPAATALANLEVIAAVCADDRFDAAREFNTQLLELVRKGDLDHVRHIGFMWAVKPKRLSSSELASRLLLRNVITRPTETHVLLSPPLVMAQNEYREAFQAIQASLLEECTV